MAGSIYKLIAGVVALIVVVLAGAYLFGAFKGMSAHGAGALIAGVAISIALGVGLMAAIFSSSREHDEAAHYAAREHFKSAPGEQTRNSKE
jgi:hypothetical protein